MSLFLFFSCQHNIIVQWWLILIVHQNNHQLVSLLLFIPSVSQGSFFQEQMSSPVSRTAWSWRLPPFPKRPDCHWQKLLRDWSAWWLMVKPNCKPKTETTEWEGSPLLASDCQVKCFLLTGSSSNSSKLTTTMLISVPMVPSLKRLETCRRKTD